MIVNMGLVKENLVKEALDLSSKNGKPFGQNMVALGYVHDSSLMQLIVAQGAANPWKFENATPDAKTLRLVSPSVMREHLLVPVHRIGDLLIIAMKDSHDHPAQERVRMLTGLRVECVESEIEEITEVIETLINAGRKEQPKPVVTEAFVVQPVQEQPKVSIESEVVSIDDTAPVAGLVDQIIADSVRREATEILIESCETGLSIRYRVDGKLRSIGDVPKSVTELVVARFRMLSSLDVLESNEPQHGTIRHKTASKDLAFDVNFVRTMHGQRILLRRSNSAVSSKRLEDIGIARNEVDLIRRALADSQGLLVVAAPTSMLRTSALYSILADLASPTREIVTVEETCGNPISGVSHTCVDPFASLSKAMQIEHMLRGSSDVFMVDGLEEHSVAALATRAALAGRLVIAGIEAKSALGAIERLQELGVDKRFVAASLCGVLGVRQVRTLCKSCCKTENGIKKSVGCPDCESTGYKGTVDLFEFLPVSEEVSRLIASGAHTADIECAATKAGLRSTAEYAIKRIERGETDVREVEQTLNCTLPEIIANVPVALVKGEIQILETLSNREIDTIDADDYSDKIAKESADLQSHFTQQSYESA